MKKIAILLLGVLIAVCSCEKSDPQSGQKSAPISITPSSAELEVGQTLNLIINWGGGTSRKSVGSENPEVASYFKSVVTANSEGKTRIYARKFDKDNNLESEAYCDITVTAPLYCLDAYWKDDYSGKLGLQTAEVGGKPTILIAGKPLYVSGVNCYDLFNGSLEGGKINSQWASDVIERLSANEVPIVRFNCGIFSASELKTYYLSSLKDEYIGCLRNVAKLCEEKHILLIPSFFWNYQAWADSCSEPYTAFGNTQSKTYKLIIDYTADVVDALKGYKSIAAWEFGNECNLAADLYKKDKTCVEVYSDDFITAYIGFADKVSSLDPDKRLIGTGNSIMRNWQWHIRNEGTSSTDTFDQYKEIAGLLTPGKMMGMSEHLYDHETRKFKDKGTVSNRDEQIEYALECAKANGKVYYVGEFNGPAGTGGTPDMTLGAVESHYKSYFNKKVQLSLVWNYAMTCNVEWSFSETEIVRDIDGKRVKTASETGKETFRYMRELNGKFRAL